MRARARRREGECVRRGFRAGAFLGLLLQCYENRGPGDASGSLTLAEVFAGSKV